MISDRTKTGSFLVQYQQPHQCNINTHPSFNVDVCDKCFHFPVISYEKIQKYRVSHIYFYAVQYLSNYLPPICHEHGMLVTIFFILSINSKLLFRPQPLLI